MPEATPTTETGSVLEALRDERQRQDERWGVQDHRSVPRYRVGVPATEFLGLPTADFARHRCDKRFCEMGIGTWADILVEEVCEAIEAAELGEEALERELVQAGAVIVAWIECIRRRRAERGAA